MNPPPHTVFSSFTAFVWIFRPGWSRCWTNSWLVITDLLISHFSKGFKFFSRTLKVMMDECALGIPLMTSLLTPVKCCCEWRRGRGLNSHPHSSAFSPLFTGCQRGPGCVSICAGTHSGLQVYQICFTHLQSTQAGQEGSDLTGPDECPHTYTHTHCSQLMSNGWTQMEGLRSHTQVRMHSKNTSFHGKWIH